MRWQYQTIWEEPHAIDRALNEMAEDGWEPIASNFVLYPDRDSQVYALLRKKLPRVRQQPDPIINQPKESE